MRTSQSAESRTQGEPTSGGAWPTRPPTVRTAAGCTDALAPGGDARPRARTGLLIAFPGWYVATNPRDAIGA
jgi:hypothetical protein